MISSLLLVKVQLFITGTIIFSPIMTLGPLFHID